MGYDAAFWFLVCSGGMCAVFCRFGVGFGLWFAGVSVLWFAII